MRSERQTWLRPSNPTRLVALLAGALLLGGAGLAHSRGGGDDDGGGGGDKALKLRLNPAIGAPGGQVAFVVRTYAARPIRQGQMTLRIRRRPPASKALTESAVRAPVRPLLQMVSATVYSQRGDAKNQTNLAASADGQAVTVNFSSASETINGSDGPLAVFKFVLNPAAVPGDVYDIQLDPVATGLVAAGGQAIAVEPLNAELTVRRGGSPFALEAEGDKVEPGETAELGIETFEPFPSAGGRITFRYPQRLAGGAPIVRIDPRYGRTTTKVDTSQAGRLVVDIVSSDASFNLVPGKIVAIDLPIRAGAAVGQQGAVTLDPAGTYLLTRKGRRVALRIENGALEIE